MIHKITVICVTNELHGAEFFLRTQQSLRYLNISQHFLKPEGSLSCSQEPATGPYPGTYESTPYHHILFPQDLFTSRFSQWSISFWFSHREPCIYVSSPLAWFMPSQCHSIILIRYIWWRAQLTKLLITQFSPVSYYFIPLGSKHSPQHPVLKHPYPQTVPILMSETQVSLLT
jgi:hypothetical protein